ncbi:tRNA (adenosine(37)-N6)-threonylcarbamoyltransferase complex transferase subunit TsaD [Candidatus Peregrinibacteria bacterium]|nr:tRNA (adenosine(37)-N6)-threonylcarbamoyltransferase complex transferase subunit TsaD [Candidatus Peregrinibacteria bacterium]
MKILGIETSCDETAAAVVENGRNVLSNVIASQIDLHKETGGVVPEVAAREHAIRIIPVVDEALKKAGTTLAGIDAIAVTAGPGLVSSLITGTTSASVLAMSLNKPLIPVNHIAGHIYANWLDLPADTIQFPIVILTVSGGHNDLVLMKEHGNFELLGETLDDAAGEAFDKVARLLGLGYPGGPHVSRRAEVGNPNRFDLPRVYLDKKSFNFSFSGLKTAMLNLTKNEHEQNGTLTEEFVADAAASFQETVCDILSDKLLKAAELHNAKEVHIAGGVSANKRLRFMMEEKITSKYYKDHKNKIQILKNSPVLRYTADIKYCTDNAAMIAGAAYFLNKTVDNEMAKADPTLTLYQKA